MTQDQTSAETEVAAEDTVTLAQLDKLITELGDLIESLVTSNEATLREHVRLGARKRELDIDLVTLGLDIDLLHNQVQYAQEAVDHEALVERGRALEESLRAASQEKHDVQQEMNRLLYDSGRVQRYVERLQDAVSRLRTQRYDALVFSSAIELDDLDDETLAFIEEVVAGDNAADAGDD